LLIDAGQIWEDDVERAALRVPALQSARVTWLEEPFFADSFQSYSSLATRSNTVALAGGEAAHTEKMATNLIDFGKVKFIQIDAARIGGIGPSKKVADYAVQKGVTYVNHTFTSHLALSASMQAFAGLADHKICEYPAEPKSLAVDISTNHIRPDAQGEIIAPDSPGLGIEVNLAGLTPYLRKVEIFIDGKEIFKTPNLVI
jgi:L-alanine-DL-glutamate epimerase-like enolase superfamily enzyme